MQKVKIWLFFKTDKSYYIYVGAVYLLALFLMREAFFNALLLERYSTTNQELHYKPAKTMLPD